MRENEVGEKSRSVRGYDQLAGWYRPLERILFADRLMQARTAMLNQLPKCDQALFFGDGDGRLLAKFCQSQPWCKTHSVDQSSEMLRRQRMAIANAANPRVTFDQANAMDFCPEPDTFDLLVCAFFLDCFSTEAIQEKMPTWLQGLKPNGHFYFVDFVCPSRGFNRIRGRAKLWLMHRFFAATTGLANRQIPNWSELFEGLPLHLIACRESACQMIVTRIYRHVPMTSS